MSASLVPFNKVPNPLSKELHPDLDEDEGSGWKVLKTKGRRDQRWPKEVVIVRELPRIPQPTREREWQKRMGRNIVVPEDGLQFAKELAELPFKPLMWKFLQKISLLALKKAVAHTRKMCSKVRRLTRPHMFALAR